MTDRVPDSVRAVSTRVADCKGLGSVSALTSLARWRARLPSRGELGTAEAGAELGSLGGAVGSELGTARAGAELGSAEAGAELGSACAGAERVSADAEGGGSACDGVVGSLGDDLELGTAHAGAELGSAEAGAELGSACAGAERDVVEGCTGSGSGGMRGAAHLNPGRPRSLPTVTGPSG